jgi:hypothetical protein
MLTPLEVASQRSKRVGWVEPLRNPSCGLPDTDGQGRYVPLRWEEDRSPIRADIPHPLAMAAFVRKALRASKGGKKTLIRQSELKLRRKK